MNKRVLTKDYKADELNRAEDMDYHPMTGELIDVYHDLGMRLEKVGDIPLSLGERG
jgi:hypothetical protein